MRPIPLRGPAAMLGLLLVGGAAPLAAQQKVVLPERDRPLAGTPVQVFAVGAEEGESWEMLNEVESVAFDRADNLFVLDRGGARVLVFDARGRFVRQIGKKGEGPGELQVPMGMALLADGTVVVADLASRAFSLFRPDGTFLRSVTSGQGAMLGRDLRAHPSGGVVGLGRPMPRLEGTGMRTATLPGPEITVHTLAGAGGARTLYRIPQPAMLQQTAGGTAERRTMQVRVAGPPTFAPPSLWGVLPNGGLAVSHTSGYTVRVTDPSGRVVRYVQRPMRTRRPTEADRERARDRLREQMRSGRGRITISVGGPGRVGGGVPRGTSPQEIEQRVREMRFADTIPALQGMTVASNGTLWIERTPRNVGDPGPIDVVTPAGQYRGTLTGQRLPRAISASGRAAYVDLDDETGVERVIVRQLPATWR